MAISSPINIGNISKGFNSLKIGLGRVGASAQGIKSILFKKTKVKQQAITGKKILQKRRSENILRKDQEDLLEASGIKPTIRGTRNAIVDSAKGFLGRILDFVGTLFVGWLLYNLPTIITMAKDLIIRIQTLFGALTGFVGNLFNVFGDIGNIFGSVLSDIVHLDFFDTDRKVRGAFDDLNTHFDNMGKQFEDGVNVFKTSLGKGKGEEEIPSTGTELGETPFGQPGAAPSGAVMTGGSNEQKVMGFLISNGLTPAQAAGVAGNLKQENSTFNPSTTNGIGAHGIAQWMPPRWSRVSAYIRSIGKDPNSLEGQLYGLVWEAQTNGVWRMIKGASSPQQASDIWQDKFEIPEIPGSAGAMRESRVRGANAAQLYSQYKNYNPQAAALNRANVRGGLKQYITGDPKDPHYSADHGGSNYHDHLAFTDRQTAIAAFNFFQKDGFKPYQFLGYDHDAKYLAAHHAANGDHPTGLAFDIAGSNWQVGQEPQGSAKVRAELQKFLGSPAGLQAQISSPGSTTNVGAITPERRGPTIAVMNQPQQEPSGGGGGGGGAAVPSIPSSDGLNSFIKQNLLLDLAYT